ncbi:hypothetical protein VNO77_28544 [Canavalia gladiata]|uniref:H/ACA ribonucleoprotein complex non-core subunit NAF1 n=1 Tax=Canavalia gladiata TaxID=3824 RepID=A0AAN9Q789_CANGL
MSEVEDPIQLNDLALADSFINYDYVPDMPSPCSDPIASGSRSSHRNTIDETIEKISLIGIGGKGIDDDNVRVETIADNESDSATSASSSTSSASNSVDHEKEELGEGDIVDSDAVDNDDSEDSSEKIAKWGIDDDDDDDDGSGGDNCAAERPVRSMNELKVLPFVPAVSVTLESHHQMLPVGVVVSILGAKVIVGGMEKHDPLNEGSILWMTKRQTPLGLIDEIFGPVKNPYYTVRYNYENEVPEGIHVGTLISFVPEFANYVLNNKDLYKKGYDTSGLNDEEVSSEAEFSDDEKEAEYKRMQMLTKRSLNHHNPGKRKNNKKKVSPKDGFVPKFPIAPAMPFLNHEHCSPFCGIGQGHGGGTNVVPPKDGFAPTFSVASATSLFDHGHCSPFTNIRQGLCGVTNIVPQFPPATAGPNWTTSGVWINGTALPLQQCAVLSNGYTADGVSGYHNNTQFSSQLPVPGIPLQQQLNLSHEFAPATIFPGLHPNIFSQLMYAQGTMDQNQITFGLSPPFSQIQPPIHLQTSPFPDNQHAPHQFNPGASANHGRKSFHRGSRKCWLPAK